MRLKQPKETHEAMIYSDMDAQTGSGIARAVPLSLIASAEYCIGNQQFRGTGSNIDNKASQSSKIRVF